MGDGFRVKFWGVRGSYPKPGSSTVRFGGNTTCLEVNVGERTLIFDAGTGIIDLGEDLLARQQGRTGRMVLCLFLTHTHYDHTQGFPFFRPAYLPRSQCYIFGPRILGEDLTSVLTRTMLSPFFPVELDEMRSEKTIRTIGDHDLVIFQQGEPEPKIQPATDLGTLPKEYVIVEAQQSHSHPKGGVFFYRITRGGKSTVFATDTEGYPGEDMRLVEFAKGTDLLIHDAQYTPEEYGDAAHTRQGYGHSTYLMATQVAKKAGARRLALTHHDPGHDDDFLHEIEAKAQKLLPSTFVAAEGMTIEI